MFGGTFRGIALSSVLCFMVLGSLAQADVVAPSTVKTIGEVWSDRSRFLASLTEEFGNESCSRRWDPILSDGHLDIVVGMGYYEAAFGPELHAADPSFAQSMVRHLTAACVTPGYNACGFWHIGALDPFGAVRLTKTITDRRGYPLQVNVTIFHSSVSWLDSQNRIDFQEKQEAKSEAALRHFNDGLRSADVVFYNGHARDGGGPDFFFPRLTRRGGTHVDYGWYQTHRPGLKALINELENPGGRAQLLGLFACATNRHFRNAIRKVAPELGYIGTDVVSGKHLIDVSLMGALDAAIGQKCQSAWAESLHVHPGYPVTLTNFF